MTTFSSVLLGVAAILALSGCSSTDPVRTRAATNFSLAGAPTYDLAPLQRRDRQPVRPEIARAVEATIQSLLTERGLRRVTDGSSEILVVAEGGVQPRTSPRYSRYTARTGVPVVEGHTFDIDEQNDATLAVSLVERRTKTELWHGSMWKSFVSSKPSPEEVSQTVREILTRLPAP